MTATITDKIMVASSGTRPNPTTLTAQKAIGASLLNADDLTGWGTSTPVTFVIYKIDSNGEEIVGTRSDWKGIVSGNTITQLTLTAGTDDIYPSGSPVVATATARWASDLTAAMLASHNQNGTLKDNSVGNTTISDNAVTASKIPDGSITNAKLSTTAGDAGGAYLSYTPTFSNLTVGNGTVNAAWSKVGKNIFVRVSVVFGSTSSMGSSRPTFSLPTASSSAYSSLVVPVGNAMLNDTSASTAYPAFVAINGSTTIASIGRPSADPAQWFTITSTSPFPWATGDSLTLTMMYEAA